MNKNAPIGIFDSGTGGLTVARAVKSLLPQEDMVYFGDTAHLPYGDKSTATIQSYTIKITNELLHRDCKVILIACNSASAAAYELIKAYVGSKALVINVIDPVVDYVKAHYDTQHLGLIGTMQTINSRVFNEKLKSSKIRLDALATPLLAPMIEEGFIDNRISQEIIDNYLGDETLQDIEALVLGCTHYPIIKSEIEDYYKGQIEIIDTPNIVAENLKNKLLLLDLLNENGDGKDQFLVSDLTPSFEKTASFFFNQSIRLEKFPLWE